MPTQVDGGVEIDEDGMPIVPKQELNAGQIKEIHDAFDFFDVDKSGYIDRHEMHDAMKSLGFKCTLQDAENLIAEFDEDENGTIEFDEFKELMKSKLGEKISKFGDQVKIGHSAALAYDRGFLSRTHTRLINTHIAHRKELLEDKQKVSNWRMKLQAEDTEYERSRFEKTKRNIKVARVHPSKKSCELRMAEDKAVRAGAFAHRDLLRKEIDGAIQEDKERHRQEVQKHMQQMESHMLAQQELRKHRTEEKNRTKTEEVRRQWRNEMDIFCRRARQSEEATALRHKHACRMLCGESHDMGMHRMRTYGKRFKKSLDTSSWDDLPSLTQIHTFSKDEEATSLKDVRAMRRMMARSPAVRVGTAVTVTSEMGKPRVHEMSNKRQQRSKTSIC